MITLANKTASRDEIISDLHAAADELKTICNSGDRITIIITFEIQDYRESSSEILGTLAPWWKHPWKFVDKFKLVQSNTDIGNDRLELLERAQLAEIELGRWEELFGTTDPEEAYAKAKMG